MRRLIFNLKLSPKYLLFGAFVGVGISLGILPFLPDGKLHMVFCDVGQGDAIYIRMPNRADMLVDGGPNDQVLTCLGKHMPFYDRTIDLVILTHPQKDHFQGLIGLLDRFQVNYFATIPVGHTTEGYKLFTTKLRKHLSEGKMSIKYLMTGDMITIGEVKILTIWPKKNWLIDSLNLETDQLDHLSKKKNEVLSFLSSKDLNIYSFYLHVNFDRFDVLLTGDGDVQTQTAIKEQHLYALLPQVEVLKVPHHGSRTGMTEEFLRTVRPQVSIIQVGKNNYGHPSEESLNQLKRWGKVLRTDLSGDIEIISDGQTFDVKL